MNLWAKQSTIPGLELALLWMEIRVIYKANGAGLAAAVSSESQDALTR